MLKEEISDIEGAISDLQRMTSGNVAHKRDNCISVLRSTLALQEIRAAKSSGAQPPQADNTGSPKCEHCENFDLPNGQYTIECYSCKRYYGDLFTLRASA